MFELITSRTVMAIAALIILASVVGIINYQFEIADYIELRNLAEKMVKPFNILSFQLINLTILVTFDKNKKDCYYLEPTINGKSYEIIINTNKITLRSTDTTISLVLYKPFHLWKPGNLSSIEEIEQKDREQKELRFNSGNDFMLEQKLLSLEKVQEYQRFVWLMG
ncbi:MAG: hypothetical protein AB1779_07100 [Candidatus Thermoplasmatota archaeon]